MVLAVFIGAAFVARTRAEGREAKLNPLFRTRAQQGVCSPFCEAASGQRGNGLEPLEHWPCPGAHSSTPGCSRR